MEFTSQSVLWVPWGQVYERKTGWEEVAQGREI